MRRAAPENKAVEGAPEHARRVAPPRVIGRVRSERQALPEEVREVRGQDEEE